MITQQIYEMIIKNEGIKCSEIVEQTDISQASVSGILSRLKKRRRVFNRSGRWYTTSLEELVNETRVTEIKTRLIDISMPLRPSGPWYEGYLSALTDIGRISEDEHDRLLDWLIAGIED